jgi:hypothetical protein
MISSTNHRLGDYSHQSITHVPKDYTSEQLVSVAEYRMVRKVSSTDFPARKTPTNKELILWRVVSPYNVINFSENTSAYFEGSALGTS